MKAWCHPTTIFKQRRILQIAGLLALCVALTTTLFFSIISRAAPGVNQIIGFQGKLLDANGNTVPDGSYNIQFKIYEGGTGTEAGNPNGELVWTESYVNNGSSTGAVAVKNGLLSVSLGSRAPFGNSVDWNNDTLWLSMNVAGTAVACSTFGSGPCAADGEMLPMKRLTSSPYALNSGALNGKTADNFIQLAQGVQNDASTNTSSIFINKTGSGNLVQLQNTASDVFTITNAGDIRFGTSSDHNISINTSGADTGGRQLAITAGAGGSGTGSSGGDLVLQGGSAGGTNGNGGNVSIDAGAKTGSGSGGTIAIGSVNASSISIGGGNADVTVGSSGSADSGNTKVQAKNSVTIETNGTTRATFSDTTNSVSFGNGVVAAAPNDFTLQGTASSTSAVAGGSLNIQGGAATVGDANGGNVVIAGGAGSGNGAAGLVVLSTPTFSTVTNDANCYAGGALVPASCEVSNSSVNNSAAVLVGFSNPDQTATLPDPTIQTAGRVLYVMAAGNSQEFTLSVNGGGTNNEFRLRPNTTATMIWNGTDWTSAGGDSAPTPLGYTSDGTKVQIGNGLDDEMTTLFTLDKSAEAPAITDEALVGSMYYDTTLGKVQCYEADGWGACSSSPDNFTTLTPEYSNAVINGTGTGTMTTDLCSDSLNINDGTSDQPLVCGTNETFNFYNWTTGELTAQTKSIYVSYQLPNSFKNFAEGSVSLLGRTDSSDAAVTYEIYRNTSDEGLTACGSAIPVSTGLQTTWQKAVADEVDPSTCGFEGGDSIVFKINLVSQEDANAYVSNLNFVFSHK